jgi:penicillin-binding protein 1A
VKPYAIQKIKDRHGNLIARFTSESHPALPKPTAYIMNMLMKDVVEQGTGQRARIPGRPVAGKTGTSSDYTNAWFVGFTPDLLTVVWIGNDRQGQSMTYKTGNIGSGAAAQLWGSYMKQVTAKRPVVDFAQPPGVVWANVNPARGEAVLGWVNQNTYKEVFDENNMPQSATYKVWHWLFPGQGKKEEDTSGSDSEVQASPTPATN